MGCEGHVFSSVLWRLGYMLHSRGVLGKRTALLAFQSVFGSGLFPYRSHT